MIHKSAGFTDTRSFDLSGLRTAAGQPVSLEARPAAPWPSAAGPAAATACASSGRRLESVPAEVCWSDLSLGAADRHILTPGDWDHLNSSPLTLQIDLGNDGSIDSTQQLVGHGLAVSIAGQPAMVRAGELLTYTLHYTVTGQTPAPGLVLSATVPAGTSLVAASQGASATGSEVRWSLGDVTPPGAGQRTYTVRVGAPPGGMIGVLARLQAGSGRWAMGGALSQGPGRAWPTYLPQILR